MMTYPLAEEIINSTPLQQLVVRDEVIADLYGYTAFVVDPKAVAAVLRRYYPHASARMSNPVVRYAVELVEEKLSAIQ